MAAAAAPKDNLSLLVFNGKKDKFRVWYTKFVAHLTEMTISIRGAWLAACASQPGRPEPKVNYEDWLHGEPPMVEEEDELKKKWH